MKRLFHSKHNLILGVLFLLFLTLEANSANATLYYVATNGNDSNSGTETLPFRTINNGVRHLSAGDTLYVKTGIYKEAILSWITPIKGGTSWNNPIKIAALPGNTVTISPPSGKAAFWLKDPSLKYIIIDGFIIDGQQVAHHGIKLSENVTYVRIQNSEIKNSVYSGILVTVSSSWDPTLPVDTYHEFINLNVHHNGSSVKDHGFYIETSHNLVENCDVHHNSANGGKFFSGNYSPGNSAANTANYNILRYNTLHDNSQNSINSAFGWLLASGEENQAYGNVSYNNDTGFGIGNGAKNTIFYNNISYNNKEYGINVYGVWGGSYKAMVYNNTVYKNGIIGIAARDGAENTEIKNNISFNNGSDTSKNIWIHPNNSPGTETFNNLMVNPEFLDPSANNFKLLPTSQAIDSGLPISEVSVDFFGVKRAQGKAYDIGAIEYETLEDTYAPSSPKNVTIVN